MSPERLQGDTYSYAADIWAFGLIVLELASGAYPYPMPDSYFQLLGRTPQPLALHVVLTPSPSTRNPALTQTQTQTP